MKKIVCFGDSNTFGFNPENSGRYDENERWTGILKQRLDVMYEVVEAGCNDRTCFCDNPKGDEFTGYKVIQNYINDDTAIIIIALGSNDFQFEYNAPVEAFEPGIKNLIHKAREKKPDIDIIILNPPPITKFVTTGSFAFQFNNDSLEKFGRFAGIYKKAAEDEKCFYLDLDDITDISVKDGLHFTREGHKKTADKIEYFILSNFDYPFASFFAS